MSDLKTPSFTGSGFRRNDSLGELWRPLAALLLAGALVFPAAAASARVEPGATLAGYVQARAAANAGALDRASSGFAAALAAEPDNEAIASQAISHAVEAGDWPLALRAARTLERRNALLPDARFLLVAEGLRTRDWRAAARQIDAVERDQLFAFAVPVLRAWLAVGSGQGDPLSFLPAADSAGASASYAAEHRPLLMIATHRANDGAGLPEATGPRGIRLRMAAAAALAARGKRSEALALLAGNEGPMAVARRLIESRRPVPGAIATPAAGAAELFVRLALDLHAQELTPVAASFARVATYLAPDSGEAWMVAAELLAEQGEDGRGHADAVALLGNIRTNDPYAAAARDQRIRLLVDGGQGAQALREAEAAVAARGASTADQVRLGEALMDQRRYADAAQAFARAIEMRREDDASHPEWALWLFRGGALDEAGDWPQARAALERAYALAPDQPLVLNYLGYAQLERRENMAEAERLVREALRLAPDNAAITDSLGWALFLKGERAEAIALLEQAVEGAPADVEINEHLGDAYFAAGRRIEARFAWTAARVYAEGQDAVRLTAKIEQGLTPQLAAR